MSREAIDRCSTILLDIAGTVGSINYTKDTLFAFAKKNIEEFLTAKWEDEETKKLVGELKKEGGEDLSDVAKAVEHFKLLTDGDSTNVGLKALQCQLYKQGYENGELKAHVFDDVKSSLEEWSNHRQICIYSTGAVDAQKQYFTHSTVGDLSAFITKYFDQAIGKKTAVESYESIAKALEVKPEDIVFLSDDIDEIKTAAKAGCATVLVCREGNADVVDEEKKDRVVISSFGDLTLNTKRKLTEEASSEAPPAKVAKVDEPVADAAAASVEMEVTEPTPAAEEKPAETMAVDTVPEETPKPEEKEEKKEEVAEPKVDETPKTEPQNSDKEVAVADTTETVVANGNDTTEEKVESKEPTPAPVNGEAETKENGKCAEPEVEAEAKAEEKENNSEIANGATDNDGEKNATETEKEVVPAKKVEEAKTDSSVAVEA